jgi:hypothetical protein
MSYRLGPSHFRGIALLQCASPLWLYVLLQLVQIPVSSGWVLPNLIEVVTLNVTLLFRGARGIRKHSGESAVTSWVT